MKNAKLLSRTKLKDVVGGKLQQANLCDSWGNSGYDICLNCCITWSSGQPNIPGDPIGVGMCDIICSRNGGGSL